jgi:hypothetical protein
MTAAGEIKSARRFPALLFCELSWQNFKGISLSRCLPPVFQRRPYIKTAGDAVEHWRKFFMKKIYLGRRVVIWREWVIPMGLWNFWGDFEIRIWKIQKMTKFLLFSLCMAIFSWNWRKLSKNHFTLMNLHFIHKNLEFFPSKLYKNVKRN